MKRILMMFRAFMAFLDRNPAIERQKRIADEIALMHPKRLEKRARPKK